MTTKIDQRTKQGNKKKWKGQNKKMMKRRKKTETKNCERLSGEKTLFGKISIPAGHPLLAPIPLPSNQCLFQAG